MMGGWGVIGGMSWFGMVLMGLFWILLAALVVWGSVHLLFEPEHPGEPDALEILKRRYAQGELTREEFEQAQATLH